MTCTAPVDLGHGEGPYVVESWAGPLPNGGEMRVIDGASFGPISLFAALVAGVPCLLMTEDLGTGTSVTLLSEDQRGAPFTARAEVPRPGLARNPGAVLAAACGALLDGILPGRDTRTFVDALTGGKYGVRGLSERAAGSGARFTGAESPEDAAVRLLSCAGFTAGFVLAVSALRGMQMPETELRVALFSREPWADALRDFCFRYPLLAEGNRGVAEHAARTGGDIHEAVRTLDIGRAGHPIPEACMRRLAGAPSHHFTYPGGIPAAHQDLRALLRAVPPDWVPVDSAQRLSFALAATALRFVHRDTGQPVEALVASCGGDWTRFLRRCLPPGDVGVPKARSFDGLSHYARHVSDRLVAPLVAHAWAGTGLAVDVPGRAYDITRAVLFRGKSLPGIRAACNRWHGLIQDIDAALPDMVPADARWPTPFLRASAGGYDFVPLTSGREMRDEGARGPGSDGAEGLAHCVAGFRSAARLGLVHILSVRVREGNGYRRVATAEISLTGDGRRYVQQLRGRRNAEVGGDVRPALDAYLALPLAPYEAPAADETSDRVMGACDYDWRDAAAVAEALAAFAPVLPRGLRGLGVRGFCEAVGIGWGRDGAGRSGTGW